MTLKEAIRAAEKLPFPDSIIHGASGISTVFVNKTTGATGLFWIADGDLDKFDNGKPVPLPE